jgi:hypothetical protein
MVHNSAQLAGKQHHMMGLAEYRTSITRLSAMTKQAASTPHFATFSSAVASNSRACARDFYTDRTG